jgi:adenylate cyclase class 2
MFFVAAADGREKRTVNAQALYEVELKFPVADPADLERRLVALAARFREPVEQTDHYFSHPCRDFGRTDEALRLRVHGDEAAITWKGPRIDAATKTRLEIELPLAAPPAEGGAGPQPVAVTIGRWRELLESLGFRPVMAVAKRRRPARVLWQGTEVEVAIDGVAGLGDYLELELQARQGEVPLARACLESLAHELGCEAPERRSYLELLMQTHVAR